MDRARGWDEYSQSWGPWNLVGDGSILAYEYFSAPAYTPLPAPANVTYGTMWIDYAGQGQNDDSNDPTVSDEVMMRIRNNTFTGNSSIWVGASALSRFNITDTPPHSVPPSINGGYLHFQTGSSFMLNESRWARSYNLDNLSGLDTNSFLDENHQDAWDWFSYAQTGSGWRAFYSTAVPNFKAYTVGHAGIPNMQTPINNSSMLGYIVVSDVQFTHPSPPAPGYTANVGYTIVPAETYLDPNTSPDAPVKLIIWDPAYPTYCRVFPGWYKLGVFSWDGNLYGNYGANPADVQRLRCLDYFMRVEWKIQNCYFSSGQIRLDSQTFIQNEFKVIFKKMWEGMNPANQIYNPTWKDDPPDICRSKLYMPTDPSDNKYKVGLSCYINLPILSYPLWGMAVAPSGQPAGSAYPFSGDSVNLQFEDPIPGGFDEFPIVVGNDLNGNCQLEPAERIGIYVANESGGNVGAPDVRGTDQTRYDEALDFLFNSLQAQGNELLPVSDTFLELFLHADPGLIERPEYRPAGYNIVSILGLASGPPPQGGNSDFREWLTHNSGAGFGSDGSAQIREYYWHETSPVAEKVAASYLLYAFAKDYWDDTLVDSPALIAAVRAYFQQNPTAPNVTVPLDGSSYVVPLPYTHTPDWVTPSTVEFYTEWDADIHFAIGRARLRSHRVTYTLEKCEGVNNWVAVSSIRNIGEIQDLYDFNQEAGGPPTEAASIQIGFGNGSYGKTLGKINRNEIAFDSSAPAPGLAMMYIGQ